MFSLQIFCPECAVDSEIIKIEHAACSLLLLQCEVLMVYVPSNLNCKVLRFDLRWVYRLSFSYKRDLSVCDNLLSHVTMKKSLLRRKQTNKQPNKQENIFDLTVALNSLTNIVRVVKSRRMMWTGHVARMGEGRGVHRVLVGKPVGKRLIGETHT